MPHVYEGRFDAAGMKFGIVVSRFNGFITDRMVEGALDVLIRHNASDSDIDIIKVPGSFEIPLAVKMAAKSARYDAVIAIGVIIRGETPNFDYLSSAVIKGIASIGLETSVPVASGVLTTETVEQAINRAGVKYGNRGGEAAASAIEMINLARAFHNKK
ncbi:MAG: 6,7-dimethyl-8-ribityllumazine synthase [Deltaproteobacteria bacterium]